MNFSMTEDNISIVILINNENIPKDIFSSSVDEYFGPQVEDFKESSLSICVLSDKTGQTPSKSNSGTFAKSQWFFQIGFAPNQIFEFKIVICENQSWTIISSENPSENRLIETFNVGCDQAIVVHLEWNKPHSVSVELLSELYSMDESFLKSHYENNETSELFKNLETIDEDNNDEESLVDSLQDESGVNINKSKVDRINIGEFSNNVTNNDNCEVTFNETLTNFNDNSGDSVILMEESNNDKEIHLKPQINNEGYENVSHRCGSLDSLEQEEKYMLKIDSNEFVESFDNNIRDSLEYSRGIKADVDSIDELKENKNIEYTVDIENSVDIIVDNNDYNISINQFENNNCGDLSESNEILNTVEEINFEHIDQIEKFNENMNETNEHKGNDFSEYLLQDDIKENINTCENMKNVMLINSGKDQNLKDESHLETEDLVKAPQHQITSNTFSNRKSILLTKIQSILGVKSELDKLRLANKTNDTTFHDIENPIITNFKIVDNESENKTMLESEIPLNCENAGELVALKCKEDLKFNDESEMVSEMNFETHEILEKEIRSEAKENIEVNELIQNTKDSNNHQNIGNILEGVFKDSDLNKNGVELNLIISENEMENISCNLNEAKADTVISLEHIDNPLFQDTIKCIEINTDKTQDSRINDENLNSKDIYFDYLNDLNSCTEIIDNSYLKSSDKNILLQSDSYIFELCSQEAPETIIVEIPEIQNAKEYVHNEVNQVAIHLENCITTYSHPNCYFVNEITEINNPSEIVIKQNLDIQPFCLSTLKDINQSNDNETHDEEIKTLDNSAFYKVNETDALNTSINKDEIKYRKEKVHLDEPMSLNNALETNFHPQEESKPRVSDIIEKFESLAVNEEISSKCCVHEDEKEQNKISHIIKNFDKIIINNENGNKSNKQKHENTITEENNIKIFNVNQQNESNKPEINCESFTIENKKEVIEKIFTPFKDSETLKVDSSFLELKDNEKDILKRSPIELRVNDDYKYPDSVTPTKVEHNLSQLAEYDVPFIDDDAFFKENWYKESNDRWSNLDKSNKIKKDTILIPTAESVMKNTPKASIETLKESEIEKVKVSIESNIPTRKRKGLLDLCGCVGGRKRS